MRSTLDELLKELGELETLVASITPVNTALAGHQDPLVHQYVLLRRPFDDATFAVALYASFEKFIENLVAAFAQLESRRLQYAKLPPKLVKKHISQTAEILFRGRVGEGRYVGLTEIEVVKNLFECLNGSRPYTLNKAAVVAHDSNLRFADIAKLFAAVGIEELCKHVCQADPLVSWFCLTQGINAESQEGVSAVPGAIIVHRIEEIVERRNLVAHRGGNSDDLLGPDRMAEAVSFIKAFSQSVFSLAVGRYLENHHLTTAIQLQQCEEGGPYRNGTVVVVEKPQRRLFVGQPVFVIVNHTGTTRWGRIQNLKVDDVDVQAVETDTATANGVGIALDFKCPRDRTLLALADDDEVVWRPVAVAAAPIS